MKILAVILMLCAGADAYCAGLALLRRDKFNALSALLAAGLCCAAAWMIWTGGISL